MQDDQKTPSSQLSAEVFAVPVADGRYLVYAPLRRAAFVTNAAMVNFIADLTEGNAIDTVDDASLELLRRLEIVGAPPEVAPVETRGGPPQPTSVTLFLTTACNLRCTYCYASAGDTLKQSMPVETAIRAIDYVVQNALETGSDGLEVNYHGGGEPTVAWKVLTESHTYARQLAERHGLTLRAYSATNGVLSRKQVDWIVNHLDGVSLSFDGLPSAQDKHRLTVSGQGSSAMVMQTMRAFDSNRFEYGVRMTVTADQIDGLPESVDFVCREFRPKRVQVEPAYKLGRWKDAPSAETNAFISAFREARARARELGADVYYSAARLDTLTSHFCGITQDSFSVSPRGNVTACFEVFSEDLPWAETFFYGKPDDTGGYEFDSDKLSHLRGQTVEHHEYCQGCFAKWHCAGDCYHKALNVNGEEGFRGSERCRITQELTKDQILERIALSGGLFWHEPSKDGRPSALESTELPE